MVELKPKDLIIITVWEDDHRLSILFNKEKQGISVYHKPTDTTVEVTHHRSQHKNRAEALIILSDLISEKSKGEVGYYIRMPDHFHKREDQFDRFCGYDIWDSKEGKCDLSYTEEAAKYLARKQIDRLIQGHEDEIGMLKNKRKELY